MISLVICQNAVHNMGVYSELRNIHIEWISKRCITLYLLKRCVIETLLYSKARLTGWISLDVLLKQEDSLGGKNRAGVETAHPHEIFMMQKLQPLIVCFSDLQESSKASIWYTIMEFGVRTANVVVKWFNKSLKSEIAEWLYIYLCHSKIEQKYS